jgi:RNA polymerase sigma factor (sigma-70 family)
MSNPDEAVPSGDPSRETQASVLGGMRLSKDSECRMESRTRFFRQYQPLLFTFFKRKGLREHDAEDLAGELIAKLLKAMDTFEYDPSQRFRSYLHTAAQNAVSEFWGYHAKRRTDTGVDLEQRVAREELQQRLEGQFDLDLLDEAKRQVRGQVSDRDWAIFVKLTEDPITPEELAKELGIERHAVDVAKSRVINRIRSATRKLVQQGPQEP